MPPNVRARSVVHPFFKSCSMQWNRRRSTNPAWTGCIGTMSARIGIRLSARTMAGAHITEATPPTKMRLRVSIGPPDINVSEISLQLSEGQVSHHSRWWLTGQGRDIAVQAVNSRSEGASRRARSWAEHPHHRWAKSHSVFQLASVHPLVRPPAGDHDNRRYARSQRGRHGRTSGDRRQDPVRPHQGPEYRLCRGISDR